MADNINASNTTAPTYQPAQSTGEMYMQTYRNVCGSDDGYVHAFDRFLAHPHLAKSTSVTRPIAGILGNTFRKFLEEGRGCAKGTPGYEAAYEPQKISPDRIEYLRDGGLRIATQDGPILIGVSPELAHEMTDGDLTVLSVEPQVVDGITPILSKFSASAMILNQSATFLKEISLGENYITRLDDYTLRIFSKGEYVGDISSFDIFNGHINDVKHSNALILKAWNNYQTRFLKKAHQLINAMNAAKTDPRGSMSNAKHALEELNHYFMGVKTFMNLHALQATAQDKPWEIRIIQGQACQNQQLDGTKRGVKYDAGKLGKT